MAESESKALSRKTITNGEVTDIQREAFDKQAAARSEETGEKLKADIDDLLDEIDEVLETEENFAKKYVQKGGE